MTDDYIQYDESDVEGWDEDYVEVAKDERYRELLANQREVRI
jgi:hypothetical protein